MVELRLCCGVAVLAEDELHPCVRCVGAGLGEVDVGAGPHLDEGLDLGHVPVLIDHGFVGHADQRLLRSCLKIRDANGEHGLELRRAFEVGLRRRSGPRRAPSFPGGAEIVDELIGRHPEVPTVVTAEGARHGTEGAPLTEGNGSRRKGALRLQIRGGCIDLRQERRERFVGARLRGLGLRVRRAELRLALERLLRGSLEGQRPRVPGRRRLQHENGRDEGGTDAHRFTPTLALDPMRCHSIERFVRSKC